MTITITKERPDTPDAIQLIQKLEGELEGFYPSESRHGYSVDKLIKLNVAFFVTRKDGVPVGCGGVQLFGKEYGEVKRMYVRPEFHDIHVLKLETGIHQKDAIALYLSWIINNLYRQA